MWRKNWSFLQSIPSNPFSMLNTPLEMLSYRTTPRPPTAQLLGMTILAPMEYGLLPGSLCVHPAPTVSGSLWWIVWELPGNWIPSISMCLDSLQAFNMFVFALFPDMANSHDDLDSLNSFVLHAFPRCWGAVIYCSLNPIQGCFREWFKYFKYYPRVLPTANKTQPLVADFTSWSLVLRHFLEDWKQSSLSLSLSPFFLSFFLSFPLFISLFISLSLSLSLSASPYNC